MSIITASNLECVFYKSLKLFSIHSCCLQEIVPILYYSDLSTQGDVCTCIHTYIYPSLYSHKYICLCVCLHVGVYACIFKFTVYATKVCVTSAIFSG